MRVSKLTWDDYAIMDWIGFGRGQKNASVREAAGYLDYYQRIEYTPEQFEIHLQRLEAAGLIRREGLSAIPTEKAKALWDECWTRKDRLRAFLGLTNGHDERFRAAFQAIEVPDGRDGRLSPVRETP
jgi:DNA-binding MarR family transcriptional regulator